MNRLAIALHRLVRELSRAGDRLLRAELGLSHSRAFVMAVVDLEGPMSQQELADRAGTTGPAVTGLLRELTADGLVSVHTDEHNRRRNLVSLTTEGRRVVGAARQLLEQRFESLLREADVDGDGLFTVLTRIEATLSKAGS